MLERLSTVTPEAVARLVEAHDDIAGAVLLATCNRFEVYLDVDADAAAPLDEVLAIAAGDAAELQASLREFAGHGVAEHLFAVSSGLESLVLGEGEIAGQVSRALESARTARTTTPDLERVFQRAAGASSAVQHHTSIGGAGRSVVRLALDLVESRIGDWRTASVVLIGTGAYAGATLAALRDRGVADVGVYSPSGRAARFARREGVSAIERDGLRAAVRGARLIVACSVATSPIITAEAVTAARAGLSEQQRQMIVDLGLPRNVEPAVGAVPGIDLLDLETLSLHAPLPELQATEAARGVLDQALGEYRAAQAATVVAPAIVALRAEVNDLVEQEISRLRRRGESSEGAERALRHLASVFVHTPSARARDAAAAGDADRFVEALRLVHGVDAQEIDHRTGSARAV